MAGHIALSSTFIPKVDIVFGETGNAEDFQVCGDLSEGRLLQVHNIPICISIIKVGTSLVVDATLSEQSSSSFALTTSMDSSMKCCGTFKLGQGCLSVPELSTALQVSYFLIYFYFLHTFIHLKVLTS